MLLSRPTLYALLGRRGQIDIDNGDSINELRTLRTLSSYFEIYYNNEAFDRTKATLGHEEIGPNRGYDFYYIRNNPEVFRAIKARRISFAYPYNEDVFRDSYALLVLTENWKAHLLGRGVDSDEKLRNVYEGWRPLVNVPILNVGQTLDPALADAVINEHDAFDMKWQTTGGFVFGYYGNLNKDLYPYMAFAALERLARDRGDVNPVIGLAGRFRSGSAIQYSNSIHLGVVPYQKMPSLHANTVANLTNESLLNHCLGNQKVIDSISRGVPVMCRRLDTFTYQLGDDYPCFYETEEEAYQMARKLILDHCFLNHARKVSLERAKLFQPQSVIDQFLMQEELQHFQ